MTHVSDKEGLAVAWTFVFATINGYKNWTKNSTTSHSWDDIWSFSKIGWDQGWTTSVRSRFGSVQCAGPTILEMESDRTDSRMNLDRTEPRPIQKQRRPTDRSGPWMTIGPDRTDAHINLGRDLRCSLRLSLWSWYFILLCNIKKRELKKSLKITIC